MKTDVIWPKKYLELRENQLTQAMSLCMKNEHTEKWIDMPRKWKKINDSIWSDLS